MTTDVQASRRSKPSRFRKTIDIAAPIEIAFEAMLDEIGPDAQMMDGTAMPFKLEAWPGGRWFRDLGNNAGTSVGACAGDQAADAARDLGADDDVVSGDQSCSISLYRRREPVRAWRSSIAAWD